MKTYRVMALKDHCCGASCAWLEGEIRLLPADQIYFIPEHRQFLKDSGSTGYVDLTDGRFSGNDECEFAIEPVLM